MTTNADRLYPSIPEATEDDYARTLEKWCEIGRHSTTDFMGLIRRTATAERRLAEAVEWLRWTTAGHKERLGKACKCPACDYVLNLDAKDTP